MLRKMATASGALEEWHIGLMFKESLSLRCFITFVLFNGVGICYGVIYLLIEQLIGIISQQEILVKRNYYVMKFISL